MNILGHDRDTLGVNGTQVSILEKTNEVRLSGLLKSENGRSLETKVAFEILSDFSNETLKRELADEQVGRLLIPTDFAEGDGSRSVTVGFLDASGGGGRLAGSLSGELLTGGFTSGRFSGGLLGTSHVELLVGCGWFVLDDSCFCEILCLDQLHERKNNATIRREIILTCLWNIVPVESFSRFILFLREKNFHSDYFLARAKFAAYLHTQVAPFLLCYMWRNT